MQGQPHDAPDTDAAAVSYLRLAGVFLTIGGTTFGGMWGATRKLEHELVHRHRWLTLEQQQALMVAATLIPAPKFLAFGGMVGFRLRGWLGSLVALACLLTPPALLVTLGVALLTPEVVGPGIVPVRRAVGVAIVGLLFGNAFLQLKGAKVKGRERAIGFGLAGSVAGAALLGVPLILAALAGFAVGAFLIRPAAKTR